MRRSYLIGITIVLLVLIAMVYIPITSKPPKDTRMIVEYTHETYIAPACFEQAEKTNNISEVTLEWLEGKKYKPESACTTEYLQPQKQSIMKIIGQKLGIVNSPWN
ncbi:hypothetical protein ACFSTH_09860 [Paenibacillus yanchengensis]|uniref:Uncharacterized protein n=1 Tax=Paenibacillus yanchengensis TaxID=2035833 RepID=A0ABW4YI21_9BACL